MHGKNLVKAVVCVITVAAIWALCVLPRWQQEEQVSVEDEKNPKADDSDVGYRVVPETLYRYWDLDYNIGVVKLQDIRDWQSVQQSYEKKFYDHFEELKYYSEVIDNYMESRCVDIDAEWERGYSGYYVLGESGELDYIFYYAYSTPNWTYYRPMLSSWWTGEEFDLQEGTAEELEEFIEDTNVTKSRIQEGVKYVTEHLDGTQYAFLDYDAEQEKLCIWLTDSSMQEELEAQGILCEEATVSVEERYAKLHELWERREELELVHMDWSCYVERLSVVSLLDEATFWSLYGERQSDMEFQQDVGAANGWNTNPLLNSELRGGMYIEELDEFIEFIIELENTWLEDDEVDDYYYDDLKLALEKLKEAYPDYTYLQLYHKVCTDCDYEWYLDFDEELEAFVDSLPAYQPELDFFSEMEYGDPEHLELKGLLRCYKELNPEMTYEEIYEKQEELKAIEENMYMSNVEKLFYRLYEKYIGKENLEIERQNMEHMKKVRNQTIIGVLAIVSVFCVGLIIFARKKFKMQPPRNNSL